MSPWVNVCNFCFDAYIYTAVESRINVNVYILEGEYPSFWCILFRSFWNLNILKTLPMLRKYLNFDSMLFVFMRFSS